MLVFSKRSCCHSFSVYGGDLWWRCADLISRGLAQICCKTFFVHLLINCDGEVVNFIYFFAFLIFPKWIKW